MLEPLIKQEDPRELSRILSNTHPEISRDSYIAQVENSIKEKFDLKTGKPRNEKMTVDYVKKIADIPINTPDQDQNIDNFKILRNLFVLLIDQYPNWKNAFYLMNHAEQKFDMLVSKYQIDKLKDMKRTTRNLPYAIHGFNAKERYAKSADIYVVGENYLKKLEKIPKKPARIGNNYVLAGLSATTLHDIIEDYSEKIGEDPKITFKSINEEFSELCRNILGDNLYAYFAEDIAKIFSTVDLLSNKGIDWLSYVEQIENKQNTPIFNVDKPIRETALTSKGGDSADNITSLEGFREKNNYKGIIKTLFKGFYVSTILKKRFKEKWRREYPETEILWNQLQQNLGTNYLVLSNEVKLFEKKHIKSKRKEAYWKNLLYKFTETGFLSTSTLRQRRVNGKPNPTLYHGYTELMANFLSKHYTEGTRKFLERIEGFDKKEIYRTLLGQENATIFNLAGKDFVLDLRMRNE